MPKIHQDVLDELKQLLEYAMRKSDWYTISDAYELLCEEMGVDPIPSEDIDDEEDV